MRGETGQDIEARLREATAVAVAREQREACPEGEWRDRLWYPSPEERRACCEKIHPCEANRQALESHCRTQAHVAQLYSVPLAALRSSIQSARKLASPRLAASMAPGDRATALCEISEGAQGKALQELQEEASCFAVFLQRLIAIETEGRSATLLEEVETRLERLQKIVEYCRRLEDVVLAARSFRETALAQGR
jgi:hypothetical protein